MRAQGRPTGVVASALGPASALAILIAAAIDPGHDILSDYVSWLSAGPYWWLAALGVAGLGAAASLDALHLNRVLHDPIRRATVTFLGCTAFLAIANIVLPSRGVGEPLWRTATHVGLAMGAYSTIIGAAILVAWSQRHHSLRGPAMAAWAVLLVVGMAALGLASSHARLFGTGPDLRGLGQLALMVISAGWLAAAARLGPSTTDVRAGDT